MILKLGLGLVVIDLAVVELYFGLEKIEYSR
jgi:hypothetical protein